MADKFRCECYILEELWYAVRYAEEHGCVIPDDDFARIQDLLNQGIIFEDNSEYIKYKYNQCDRIVRLDKELSTLDKEAAIELLVNNEDSIKHHFLSNFDFNDLLIECLSSKVWYIAKAIYDDLPNTYKLAEDKLFKEMYEKHPNLAQYNIFSFEFQNLGVEFSSRLEEIKSEAINDIFKEWKTLIHRLRNKKSGE